MQSLFEHQLLGATLQGSSSVTPEISKQLGCSKKDKRGIHKKNFIQFIPDEEV
jgi:hypothetical protein